MEKTKGIVVKGLNPIINGDYPDADVIRVGDVYYMLVSTYHFLPGGLILRSYDLINWEIASYVFDVFEGTEEARMKNERSNYGCGMWAGSLRYHKDKFYVSFAAKETAKTYFYSADSVEGPWERKCIDFYFHHGSLFFDEDDRVYLVFGSSEIWIRELLPDLSGLKPGGFVRRILSETDDVWLGYEGCHFYKINGIYYLFTLHWPKSGTARRTQLCFRSDSLEGEFTGGEILNDTLGYENNGIAKGGIVETNDGHWFSILMQDRGAAGRVPVLVPVAWKDGYPVFGRDGKVPEIVENISNRPHYEYEPLYTSDDFFDSLKQQWQWNHEPDAGLWTLLKDGGVEITTGKICTNVTQAVNTLTQRMLLPKSSVEVTVDASDLNEGDFAGICALQGCYGMLAVTKEFRRFQLVLIERENTEKNRTTSIPDYMPGVITEKISLSSATIRLRMDVEYGKDKDVVTYFYREPRAGGKWRKVGTEHKLFFGLDHFSGCRCGLAIYATKMSGGSCVFREFEYHVEK